MNRPFIASGECLDPASRVWDALVVGAGPAGCAAAYDLAAGGASVLLVDRSDFPRSKACAGGLTMKAVEALRYSVKPVVQRIVNSVRLERERAPSPLAQRRGFFPKRKNDGSVLLRSREPVCVMTVRSELDAFCLKKTIEAGASFRRISTIRHVARSGAGVSLLTGQESFSTRFLVGADGATSQIRRLCADGGWFSKGFALEAQVHAPQALRDLVFDFGAVKHGYGWIFPKADHVNVGLYCESSTDPLNRGRLLAYVKEKLGTDAAEHTVGQYLGMGAWRSQTEDLHPDLRNRLFLVGDAGGFVDPLTGEGIYGAVVSGQAAAKAILAEMRGDGPASQVFAGELAEYRKVLGFSSRAAEAFYLNPERGFQALRFPLMRRLLVKTYVHGFDTRGLVRRIALSRL